MEKLEKFITDYDSLGVDVLPKFMKRRVDALKKIQLEHVSIQTQYHKELQELEMKYEKLYAPLYEKRHQIVGGQYEPTDDECSLPASILDNECDGDQENKEESTKPQPLFTEEEEKAVESKVKGLPGFWLGCLLSSFNFNESIEKYDRPVLRYLNDVKLTYEDREEYLTYRLDFMFSENPYFTNKVLNKTYFLKKKPDEKDPFSFEGYEVCRSEGCEINWNPGKDVMQKTVLVKQKNKNDGRTRQKKKEVERDSFFYFFKPPEVPETNPIEMSEELASVIGIDFELGEIFRQCLIPKAVLYYSGYMVEEDEDDDEDDDELELYGHGMDESDDESDDDVDDSDEESDESEETDDSLEKSNVDKKKLIATKKSPSKKSP